MKETIINIFVLIIRVTVILVIILYGVSMFSTYQVYGGEENETNRELAPTLCGEDDLIGVHGSCCHIQVYCKKFWWPVHCYTHIGATKNYEYCKYEWSITK